MVDIRFWIDEYEKRVQETFGDRVWFIGLQGSYARGEADESSDIDAVCVLDELAVSDVIAYGRLLDTLPDRHLTCGFFGGKRDLLGWEPSELFQFCRDTIPVYGSLDSLLEVVDDAAVDRAILQAACGVYHGCIHNLLFEKSDEVLRGLCKSAAFAVQASVFRQTGFYLRSCDGLLEKSTGKDHEVVALRAALKDGVRVEFVPMSEILLSWAQENISR